MHNLYKYAITKLELEKIYRVFCDIFDSLEYFIDSGLISHEEFIACKQLQIRVKNIALMVIDRDISTKIQEILWQYMPEIIRAANLAKHTVYLMQ